MTPRRSRSVGAPPRPSVAGGDTLYDKWSWRAIAVHNLKVPSADLLFVFLPVSFAARTAVAYYGAPVAVLVVALTALLSISCWFAWRFTWSLVAGRPLRWRWRWLGICLAAALVIPAGASGRVLQAVAVTALVAALSYPVRAVWHFVRYWTTHEGTVVVMTLALAALIAALSVWAFRGTLPPSRDLQARGGLVVLTSDPAQDVVLGIRPARTLDGSVDPHQLDVEVYTDGPWLLIASGRWAGDWDGEFTQPGSPFPFVSSQGRHELQVDGVGHEVTWLGADVPVQMQGRGHETLSVTTAEPFLYDDQGHRAVVFARAGCLTNLPWLLTLDRHAADDLTLSGWATPRQCTVIEGVGHPAVDYVETSTFTPTIEPNTPAWSSTAVTDTPEQLEQRLADLHRPSVENDDGTITLDLFVFDPLAQLGGTRSIDHLTAEPQVWTADSTSIVESAAFRQAMAITGFGAAGALLGSVLLALTRLAMGLTTWRQRRSTAPGFPRRVHRPGIPVTWQPRPSPRSTPSTGDSRQPATDPAGASPPTSTGPYGMPSPEQQLLFSPEREPDSE